MIKNPKLIVFGIILFGLLLFGVGVYLLAAEKTATTSGSNSPVIYTSPPATSTPVANKSKVKPSISPTPVPTAIPIKRAPSTVQWIKKDDYLGSNTWKVNLSSDTWFDTGIPYVTNDTLNINEWGSQETNPGTLIKVNGRVFRNSEGRQIFFFDRDGFKITIRDTVKLKLDEGALPVELQLAVNHVNGVCIDYTSHGEIHQESIAWSETMVNRTKR